MKNDHITNEYLQLFLDGRLVPDERVFVERHMQSCVQCRRAYQSLSLLDASLRVLPVERTKEDFTHLILTKLDISPQIPFLFRIVENLAYVFGLFLVLGIMLAAFLVTGVIDAKQVVETQSTASHIGKSLMQQLDAFADGLTVFLQSYMPFMFGSRSMKIAFMSTLIVGMLALFDRVLRRRFHM